LSKCNIFVLNLTSNVLPVNLTCELITIVIVFHDISLDMNLFTTRHICVTLLIIYICVQVNYQLFVHYFVIDYPYYQLLLITHMCFICIQVN